MNSDFLAHIKARRLPSEGGGNESVAAAGAGIGGPTTHLPSTSFSLARPDATMETSKVTTHHMKSSKTPEAQSALHEVVGKLDAAALIKLLLHEVGTVGFKTKKERTGMSDDQSVLGKLLDEMKEILSCKFVNVDLKNSGVLRLESIHWDQMSAIHRSDAGKTGIYFIQFEVPRSQQRPGAAATSVLVAKPIHLKEFACHEFVNKFAADFLCIRCPRIRSIPKDDAEYQQVESNVQRLFSSLPAHRDKYEVGGDSSPKRLFSTNSILLMELVKGKPLCHRCDGQRELLPIDYRAIGRLFLMDLLVRNTDRLPCRKAIPRPGYNSIANQGNPGNLMFGETPGSLWAIDPEMQTQLSEEQETLYLAAVHSVVDEIVHEYHRLPQFMLLSKLFYERVQFLEGILDVPLDETLNWSKTSQLQQHGIDVVLQLIRVRAAALDSFITNHPTYHPPPEDNNEQDWREWIRMTLPRAVPDVVEFIEAHTGFVAPASAAANVEQGFLEAMAATKTLRKDLKDAFKITKKFSKLLEMAQVPESGVPFIIKLIESLEVFDSFLPTEAPHLTCEDIYKVEMTPNGVNDTRSIAMARRLLKLKKYVHQVGAEAIAAHSVDKELGRSRSPPVSEGTAGGAAVVVSPTAASEKETNTPGAEVVVPSNASSKPPLGKTSPVRSAGEAVVGASSTNAAQGSLSPGGKSAFAITGATVASSSSSTSGASAGSAATASVGAPSAAIAAALEVAMDDEIPAPVPPVRSASIQALSPFPTSSSSSSSSSSARLLVSTLSQHHYNSQDISKVDALFSKWCAPSPNNNVGASSPKANRNANGASSIPSPAANGTGINSATKKTIVLNRNGSMPR